MSGWPGAHAVFRLTGKRPLTAKQKGKQSKATEGHWAIPTYMSMEMPSMSTDIRVISALAVATLTSRPLCCKGVIWLQLVRN